MKRFSNQTVEQILNHLKHVLDTQNRYNLKISPLNINLVITESTKRTKKKSMKKEFLRTEQKSMKKRQRRLSNTKKRTKPKIRSVKKGRTITLKGRTY